MPAVARYPEVEILEVCRCRHPGKKTKTLCIILLSTISACPSCQAANDPNYVDFLTNRLRHSCDKLGLASKKLGRRLGFCYRSARDSQFWLSEGGPRAFSRINSGNSEL